MKYVIYLRVSTKKQDTDTQLLKCLEFLRQKDISNFGYLVFSDSITSKKPLNKRKGICAALAAIRPGDVLVGQKIDRLSRNSFECHDIKRKLDEIGAELLLTDQPGISNKVIFGVYIGIAEEEVKMIRARTKDNLWKKSLRNERVGTIPYGFKLDMENLILVNGEDGKKVLKPGLLLPNPEEERVLAVMSDLFALGNSYREIAAILTEQGYKNRKGNPFHHMSIYRILSRIGLSTPQNQPHEETVFELLHSKAQ